MKAIAAVDSNWGIGYKGDLLEKIPEDLKFFKQTTLNKVVVMGRETFESLPGKEPLKNRTNIILSSKGNFEDKRLTICQSFNDLFRELAKYSSEDVFIIGGASIYSQLLPYCTDAYITKIENTYIADKFFPNLDTDLSWSKISNGDYMEYNNIRFRYEIYRNNKPNSLDIFNS